MIRTTLPTASVPRSQFQVERARLVLGATRVSLWLAAFAAALLVGGCGGTDAATIAIGDARVTPDSEYPLGVSLDFVTTTAAAPVVTVIGPDGDWLIPGSGIESSADRTRHHAIVVGLRPRTAYRFRIAGPRVMADESLSYETGAVPAGFPKIDVHTSTPERMQPGLTLVALSGIGGGWLLALDASGRPVWYFRPSDAFTIAGTRQLPDGRIAFLDTGWRALHIVDVLTRTETRILAEQLGVDTIHHEPNFGPDGHLLLLSSELRQVSGFADGATRPLVGDVISEATVDGQVIRQWHSFEILDPHRLLADASIPFWQGQYPGIAGLQDWTHLNSVVYVEHDDSFVVSSLNQHLIFKMDREGALRWVLGDDRDDTSGDDGWPFLRRDGDEAFPLRQHSVEVGAHDDHVWLYDNGFDSLQSRATELVVDERARTAAVAWSWIDPDHQPRLFTPVGGDFDVLANGNRLVYSGLNLELAASLSELDGATDEKVFDVHFPKHGGFNAVRIASLYPPDAD